jgi:hypothetical protein
MSHPTAIKAFLCKINKTWNKYELKAMNTLGKKQ